MFCKKDNTKKAKVAQINPNENSTDIYINILAPNNEPNMTKPYKPQMAQIVDNPLDPQSLKRYILSSENMEQIIKYYSKKMNQTPQEVRKQVKILLDEIGLDRNLSIIRWCGIAITYISKRITKGIFIHQPHILRLKNSLGPNPVLYLPCHRSYMDFILLSYVFFHYDIEIPGITAGMDFHAMFSIGTMLRKTGAFFMRRIFSNESLYWDVFQNYVNYLVEIYHIGLEFFVEGTRSRTTKALVPKVGLLSMALKSYIMGCVPDITIIPIGISYERVTEEQLFVYELLGVPKPKESTKGFFKALKIMDEKFGRIYIDFGKPISVKSFLGPQINRMPHTTVAPHLQALKKSELDSIKQLANEVVYQQQRHIIIHLFNLLCLSYASRLYNSNTPISVNNLVEDIIQLRIFMKQLDTPLTKEILSDQLETLKSDVLETIQIHSNTLILHGNEKVKQINISLENLTQKIDATKMKAHSLQPLTMAIAIPSLSLQLYINPSLFWLVRPSYLIFAALKLQKEQHFLNQSLKEQLKEYAYELEDIFKFEFIIDNNHKEEEFKKNLQILEINNILHISEGNQISVNLNNVVCHALFTTLIPFLCLYYQLVVTLNQEFKNKKIVLTNMEILTKMQQRIESSLLQQYQNEKNDTLKRIEQHMHPYCLALDNINTALYALVQDSYLIKQKDLGTLQIANHKSLHVLEQRLLNYCNLIPFNQYYAKDELQQHLQDQPTRVISKL